ncbi:hypothetical protein [Streptomyces uncialis]|uniref:hypothetical protein n=1 Tax=Streptomyces uncialis TaxID=1048205 RepID=UPI002256EF02|nr:hypothetical protein [Streptomyces uncialis]MCX4661365.1 hypothetical protein [Streptomyces uncialis]
MTTTRLCDDCQTTIRWWHHPCVRRINFSASGPGSRSYMHRSCAEYWAISCAACVRARIFGRPEREHRCYDTTRVPRFLPRSRLCPCSCRTGRRWTGGRRRHS